MTEETRLRNEKKFIEKSIEVHGDKYNYSKVNYTKDSNKVEIVCKEHGSFWQLPKNHKKGSGCNKCAIESKAILPLEKIIYQFKEVHQDLYNYSEVNYRGDSIKVEIICDIHGSFWQRPQDHKRGNGCPNCAKMPSSELLLSQFREVHGDRCDYSRVDYKGALLKVEIICKEHGSFWQRPNDHKRGNGCPKCKESKGERKIREYLESKNINFIQEYSLIISHEGVDYNNRFDFFLPDLNIHIEFDGVQHFEPIEFFGGEAALENRKSRDNIKDIFCENNNLKMIRIPYWDENRIDEILDGNLSYF